MKSFWIILNLVLLATLNAAWFSGLDNLFGMVLTTIIVLSFPLNLLVGWIFFSFELGSNFSGVMLLMGYVMSLLSYLQWFEAVPRIASYFSEKFSMHDISVNVSLTRPEHADAAQLNHPDLQNLQFDDQFRSPVERVFAAKDRH